MTQVTAAIEMKLVGLPLANLTAMLTELDSQIAEARANKFLNNDYSAIQAMNSVRIALLNQIEEQDADFHTNYVSERVGA
jgi:hypothetical protein